MIRHTPGPWKTERMTAGVFMAITADSKPRTIGTVMDRPDGALEANASLMAAAPELLTALRDIQEFCDDPQGSEKSESLALGLARLLPAARAAIQKATGTQ